MFNTLRMLRNISMKIVLLIVVVSHSMWVSLANSDVLYIGDTVFNNVANELQMQSSEFQEFGQLLNHTNSDAGIGNFDSWLYNGNDTTTGPSINAVVLSLGYNDLRKSRRNAASDAELARGVYEILHQLDFDTPVFWILPHSYMPQKRSQKRNWQRVVNAIMHAYNSGEWPQLYVVNLEEWAMYSSVNFTDLLTHKENSFSQSGSKTVAELVIYYLNNPPATDSAIAADVQTTSDYPTAADL